MISSGGTSIRRVNTWLTAAIALPWTPCECIVSNSFQSSASNPSKMCKWWNSLWKLNIPPKVRFFIWRVCSNAVPTLENMWKKKILNALCCSRCNSFVEYIGHALFDCKEVKKVWYGTSFGKLFVNFWSLPGTGYFIVLSCSDFFGWSWASVYNCLGDLGELQLHAELWQSQRSYTGGELGFEFAIRI